MKLESKVLIKETHLQCTFNIVAHTQYLTIPCAQASRNLTFAVVVILIRLGRFLS